MSITQARGCYWGKCDYCDFVELYDGSPPFRGRQPEEFVRELEELVAEYGISDFIFITESIPPAFARRMSTLLIERQVKISWISFAMVDRRFDKALLTLMKEAGCHHLVIGLETTVTRLLKLVNKSADRAENMRFLRDAKEVGMLLRVNLIPDLPSATYQEAMQCLSDIKDFQDSVDGIAVFPFEPTRSSNVGRFPARFGLMQSSAAGGTGIAIYSLNHMDSVDPAMTPEERAEVHKLFQELEDSTVRRKRMELRGGGPALTAGEAAGMVGGMVRVPIEDLDVVADGQQVVCHDMRTFERVRLSADAARALIAHSDGLPFAGSALCGGTAGSASTDAIARELIGLGLLMPAQTRSQ